MKKHLETLRPRGTKIVIFNLRNPDAFPLNQKPGNKTQLLSIVEEGEEEAEPVVIPEIEFDVSVEGDIRLIDLVQENNQNELPLPLYSLREYMAILYKRPKIHV